jgi:hypothetical protein
MIKQMFIIEKLIYIMKTNVATRTNPLSTHPNTYQDKSRILNNKGVGIQGYYNSDNTEPYPKLNAHRYRAPLPSGELYQAPVGSKVEDFQITQTGLTPIQLPETVLYLKCVDHSILWALPVTM